MFFASITLTAKIRVVLSGMFEMFDQNYNDYS